MVLTVRTKLTLLLIAVGVALLCFSTALALWFSTRALDRQTRVYADLFARQVTHHVQALWQPLESDEFAKEIRTLTQPHEQVVTVDVFYFTGAIDRIVSSHTDHPPPMLSADERQAMRTGQQLASDLSLGDADWIQVLTPLATDGEIVGAVRVRTNVTGLRNLQEEEVTGTVLLAIAFALGGFLLLRMFLERQVNQPLEQLARGMNQAEAGNLATRVTLTRNDELGQLADHFNRMLARVEVSDAKNRALVARIQQFNGELEERIEQATHDLVVRNQELLRLQREIDRVEPLAALGRVTGAIAHELGTPLNTILGYSQLLAQEHRPDHVQENAHIIETQARRMAEIIRYYLSRTRDAARHYQAVDLNIVVQNTLTLLTPMFQQRQVTVQTALREQLPVLQGDSASLERVLINVLKNAVDAMTSGGSVKVTTREVSPPQTAQTGVQVVVTDTGAGIPAELLPRIFDLFVTTKEPGAGTGLGLALCQEILKAHGGAIAIASEVGQGTTVTMFLPAVGMLIPAIPMIRQR